MLLADPRGSRVAVVADVLANPEPGSTLDVVAVLQALDYGMIVPPPHDFAVPTIGSIVEYLVDDLLDYRRNGYVVVAVVSGSLPGGGAWLDVIDGEIARRGAVPLDVIDVDGLGSDGVHERLTACAAAG